MASLERLQLLLVLGGHLLDRGILADLEGHMCLREGEAEARGRGRVQVRGGLDQTCQEAEARERGGKSFGGGQEEGQEEGFCS